MRVVVVTTEPPDPFGTAASRWFYVLMRGLVARGQDVTMLSACSDPHSQLRASALFPGPVYDLQCFALGSTAAGALGKVQTAWRPYSYVFSPKLKSAFARECDRGYDILHLEHLWSGWLAWEHTERALLNVHYLMSSDLQDTEPAGLREQLIRMSTFAAERRLLARFKNIATLTDRLATDVRRLAPKREPFLLPLGIDATLYPFSADDPAGVSTLGMIGNYAWTPTYRAAVRLKRLWPRIKASVPEARLLIVGRNALSRLGRGEGDQEIVDNVPDIVPYFQRMHVLLYAPEHGSGTKVKIQESLALGVPVVTNAEGGEGIPGRDGEHWGLADDDDGLVERAIELLRTPSLRRSRRLAGRALLERAFGPERCISKVLDAYASIMSEQGR